jgi:hypothetical protein
MASLPWRVFLLPLALATVAVDGSTQPALSMSRVVAVGDVHGAIDQFRALLRTAGITDQMGAWIAGRRTTFVQTGDFTDRGAGVRAVMDLLITLERRAAAAGARAHALLGNHEAMNLLGDTRDATPEIFATFADGRSEKRREEAWRQYETLGKARSARFGSGAPPLLSRDEWMSAHPRGYLEYRAAFAPNGQYGRWLRQRAAVLRVGDTIFLHGGIHPEMAAARIEDFNKQVEREIRQFDDSRRHLVDRGLALEFSTLQEVVDAARAEIQFIAAAHEREQLPADVDRRHLEVLNGITRFGTWALLHPNGPLWFRGFATWSSAEGAPQIAGLLEKYGARRFVVGHTVLSTARITPRFGGRVFLIDTGMLSTHYPGGRASALEIAGDTVAALYEDGRVSLAANDPPLPSVHFRDRSTSSFGMPN